MKELMKQNFVNVFSTPIFKIENKILNYEVISFDIFDTLIKRDIKNPSDIFDLIEKKYNIKNFKEARILAEKNARINSKDEEISLDDIYNNMSFSKEEAKKIKNIEIQIEKDICTRNNEIYKIYKKMVENHKKIYFVSDMYLPLNVIEEILNKNGYDKYESIYLSSKEKLTKASGNLFKKLIDENNLKEKSIVHIGDSIKGDFINPRKYKIHSILIKRINNKMQYYSENNNELDYNILSSFINNKVDYNWEEYEKFGYEIFGPILYSFTLWIHNEIKKENINKIYFLARDAKIIMDAYKKLYNDDAKIYYLYLSRKIMLFSNLYRVNNFEELYDMFNSLIKDTSKIKDVLDFLNIDYKKFEAQLIKNNIELDDVLMNISNEQKEILFSLIKGDLQKNSKTQYDYLKKYLNQNDFSGKVALIDIGWNGTIQYYLNEICNASINGYYYGVEYINNKYSNINRKGYLFDENNKNDNNDIIKFNVGLFELMFISTEGTTLYLKEENGVIKPVKGKKDLNNNIDKILKIHQMANRFIDDVIKSNDKYLIDELDANAYFENYKNIILNPTLKDIKMFKNIIFTNINDEKLINNRSAFYYLFNPKKLYIDFRNSTCRIMFMKSVCKIKLPYYKILKKIYDKINGN